MKWQPDSKILVQGINHHPLGTYYATQMQAYGTQLVGGVSTGYGGQMVGDIPIFDLVEEVVATAGTIDMTVILNPAYEVLDAALEAIAAGIRQLIIVSGGVPPLDMVYLLRKAEDTHTFILGSGSQGLLIPNQLSVGTLDVSSYQSGQVGIISHCDALTDDIARELSEADLGQSLVVSLGTDGLIGSNFEQWLQIMEEDEQTEVIVLLGQPNSNGEMRAADYVASAIEKPVIGYLTGRYATLDKHFGDSSTIIANQLSYAVPAINSVQKTIMAFEKANIPVTQKPWELSNLIKQALNNKNTAEKS
ncbi:MAG: CoA-binding protein [Snowella sp.]|nr:CoA-binding protein [Snowella sp.]